MDATGVEGSSRFHGRKPQSHAAIIFGTASSYPGRRPASVRATCEAIGLARSTYYYQSHRAAAAVALEQKIVQRLLELRNAHPGDGYRRMTQHLLSEGLHVNRKRIARLMHLHRLGVRASQPQAGATHLRGLLTSAGTSRQATHHPTGTSQVWIADLAYVHILSGLIYAAAIVDVWSREVVGYAASTHISVRLPALALHSAARAHGPAFGCIHHSTCGTQHLTREYRELLRQYGLIPSAGDTQALPALGAPVCATAASARQIVEMPDYTRWDEVVARSQEFVRALYSRERIEQIVQLRAKNGATEGLGVTRLGLGH